MREVLNAYAVISRGRQYVGMSAVPLPLGIGDITLYLSSKPVLIDSAEFDACIFALDNAHREGWESSQKHWKKKK